MKKYVLYSRQSKVSGLSGQMTLETAEFTIRHFLQTQGVEGIDYKVIASFEEIKSGYGKSAYNREQFNAAYKLCKDNKYTLVVSNASRLARNTAFGSKVLEDIDVILASNPTANKTMKNLMLVLSEDESLQQSSRRTAAYKAKKERCEHTGEKLVWGANSPNYGKNSKGGNPNRNRAAEAKSRTVTQAERIKIIAQSVDKSPTYAMIAEKLNKQSVVLPNGKEGIWSPIQVKRICDRHEINIYNC